MKLCPVGHRIKAVRCHYCRSHLDSAVRAHFRKISEDMLREARQNTQHRDSAPENSAQDRARMRRRAAFRLPAHADEHECAAAAHVAMVA